MEKWRVYNEHRKCRMDCFDNFWQVLHGCRWVCRHAKHDAEKSSYNRSKLQLLVGWMMRWCRHWQLQ